MRMMFVSVLIFLLSACTSGKKNIDFDTALANVRTYVSTRLDDFKTMDSFKIYLDTLTEKRRLQKQMYEYIGAVAAWNSYDSNYDPLNKGYNDDYKSKQAANYEKLVEGLKSRIENADSTNLMFWDVTFTGIITRADMTQEMFRDNVYMTKDYKIIPKSRVLDYPSTPYSGNEDKILTLNYPYIETSDGDTTVAPIGF